ncbi:MAG: hypothetical protein AMXMBFR13_26280 [Phycisphaerae bacterium]
MKLCRYLFCACLILSPTGLAAVFAEPPGKTVVTIRGDAFLINDRPTYQGRHWNGRKIEGLLLNARLVQGVFDDLNPETRDQWAYPDTGKWDPDRNTSEFVAAMPAWREHGLLAFTINLQGGCPRGYCKEQPWINSALTEDGELRPAYMERLVRILDRTDELGMVAILGVFYFGQDQRLRDEAAVVNAMDNVADWVLDRGYTNVLIEVNNECNVAYDHDILKPDRVHELIQRVKERKRGDRRLLVSTSYGGGTIPKENVVRHADFLLLHGNGVSDPKLLAWMVREARKVPGYRPMPILVNEDDHFDFDKPTNNMTAAIGEYCSWGYFDPGKSNYRDGHQCPPVRWDINTPRKQAFFAQLAEVTGGSPATTRPADASSRKLLLLDEEALAYVRQRIKEGDPELRPALEALLERADQALGQTPLSVMDKQTVPPSGDKHDYMSQGTYWWPNSDTADGLPYVRKDGVSNPEGNKLDLLPMRRMCTAVDHLALAYYFTGRERYAEHAARLLRVWFLDPATRMNPHLTYGQAIPGICTGRAIGIIDTHVLADLIDRVQMLADSKAWTSTDSDGFKAWMSAYLTWLLESKEGREEAIQPNNHGSWYDVQVAALALFVGKPDIARQTLSKSAARRIDPQIEPDGRQPWELRRTKSFGYSCANLRALVELATLGRHVNVDLWKYESSDGRSIRKAIDFLARHVTEEKAWEYEQIQPFSYSALVPLLRRAAIACHEPAYEALVLRLCTDALRSDLVHLAHPRPAWATASASP